MCGVFGWSWERARPSGDEMAKRATIALVLAHHMDRRGDQSWGVYAPETGLLHKQVGSITDSPLLGFLRHRTLMGHTRWATQGTVCEKNAHPFEIGDTVGAHNGILSNHEELNRKHNRLFRVDSMHLFAHIENGVPLDDIEGYGAVEFATRGDNAVFLGRFNTSDLHVWRTSIGAVWASTRTAIEEALTAAGIEGNAWKVEENALYYVERARLYVADPEFFSGIQTRRYSLGDWGRGTARRHFHHSSDDIILFQAEMHRMGIGQDQMWRIWEDDFDPFDIDDPVYKYDTRGELYDAACRIFGEGSMDEDETDEESHWKKVLGKWGGDL